MGRNDSSSVTETLVFKLIPLIFAVPLMLRIFEFTPPSILSFLQFNIESFTYAVILIAMGLVSLIEMNFARHDNTTFVSSMNAGATILASLAVTGFILGGYVLFTEYAFNGDLDTVGRIIAWYMLIEIIFVLLVGIRIELAYKVRFGNWLKNKFS